VVNRTEDEDGDTKYRLVFSPSPRTAHLRLLPVTAGFLFFDRSLSTGYRFYTTYYLYRTADCMISRGVPDVVDRARGLLGRRRRLLLLDYSSTSILYHSSTLVRSERPAGQAARLS
jgi:hypothetical protein